MHESTVDIDHDVYKLYQYLTHHEKARVLARLGRGPTDKHEFKNQVTKVYLEKQIEENNDEFWKSLGSLLYYLCIFFLVFVFLKR